MDIVPKQSWTPSLGHSTLRVKLLFLPLASKDTSTPQGQGDQTYGIPNDPSCSPSTMCFRGNGKKLHKQMPVQEFFS